MRTEKKNKRVWYRPKWAWYNVVELAIALAIICPTVMLAAYFGLARIQSEFCPTNAFLWGPTQIGEIVLLLPWFFVGMMVGFYVVYKFELRVRHVFGATERSEFWETTRGVPRTLRKMDVGWLLRTVSIVMIPISLAALPSYFCASPDGVVSQASLWAERKLYKWEDVREVVTECYHVGRTNRDSFTLIMPDGAGIDLGTRPREFLEVYPMISAALRGRDFSFAAVRIEQCASDRMPAFATRPGEGA